MENKVEIENAVKCVVPGEFIGVFKSKYELNAYKGALKDNDYAFVLFKGKANTPRRFIRVGTAWICVDEKKFSRPKKKTVKEKK